MRDALTSRAAGRVMLACRALSAAVDDLAAAHRRYGTSRDEAALELEAERERVCELGEELVRRTEGLGAIAQSGTDDVAANGRAPRAAPARRAGRRATPRAGRTNRSSRSTSR
jgi:hypothetical protein